MEVILSEIYFIRYSAKQKIQLSYLILVASREKEKYNETRLLLY